MKTKIVLSAALFLCMLWIPSFSGSFQSKVESKNFQVAIAENCFELQSEDCLAEFANWIFWNNLCQFGDPSVGVEPGDPFVCLMADIADSILLNCLFPI